MNTYFLPRPSLRGAILWQRRRSTIAITFSRIVLLYSTVMSVLALAYCFMNARAIGFVLEHWRAFAMGLLLVNVATASLVWIGPGGVRARRLFVPWARTQRAPLGGEFYDCESETDDWMENDRPDNRWNRYAVLNERNEWIGVTFPGLRPAATAEWLTEQLHRIEAQQFPSARVVEREPAESDTVGATERPTGSPGDRA
jgi:hypothetical protein